MKISTIVESLVTLPVCNPRYICIVQLLRKSYVHLLKWIWHSTQTVDFRNLKIHISEHYRTIVHLANILLINFHWLYVLLCKCKWLLNPNNLVFHQRSLHRRFLRWIILGTWYRHISEVLRTILTLHIFVPLLLKVI